jgi:GNAT superfamily N-acetyltransferase
MNILRQRFRPASRPILEPARPTDAEAIGLILSDWIDETPWMPRIHKRAEEQDFARDLVARGWVTVARRCGRVAGFLARDGDEIIALYIAGHARGQGIGTALLKRAQKATPRLSLWAFQFNEPARAFYEARGFREVERTGGARNDEKLPDIRYVWEKAR